MFLLILLASDQKLNQGDSQENFQGKLIPEYSSDLSAEFRQLQKSIRHCYI